LAAHRKSRQANTLVLLDDDMIHTWHRLHKEEGIEGLASFGYEGGACRLSEAQPDRLKAWISETPPWTTHTAA
jgi:transposase